MKRFVRSIAIVILLIGMAGFSSCGAGSDSLLLPLAPGNGGTGGGPDEPDAPDDDDYITGSTGGGDDFTIVVNWPP
jgi:hypothetical protein